MGRKIIGCLRNRRAFSPPETRQGVTASQRPLAGFSILEIVVVALIIGFLAALGIPRYQNMIERSRASEAYAIFKTARDGYLAVRAQTGPLQAAVWDPDIDAASDPDWQRIFMDNPNADPNRYFAYNITPQTQAVSAHITALRRNGSPPFAAYTNNVDNNRFIAMNLDTADIDARSSPY